MLHCGGKRLSSSFWGRSSWAWRGLPDVGGDDRRMDCSAFYARTCVRMWDGAAACLAISSCPVGRYSDRSARAANQLDRAETCATGPGVNATSPRLRAQARTYLFRGDYIAKQTRFMSLTFAPEPRSAAGGSPTTMSRGMPLTATVAEVGSSGTTRSHQDHGWLVQAGPNATMAGSSP